MKLNNRGGEVLMGNQLYPERFVWFDHEARNERYPNYTDPAFQLPVINHSEEEPLTLFISRKVIIEGREPGKEQP